MKEDLKHADVSPEIDHDTAQFAATSIRRWWTEMGSNRFPRASELLITADAGRSNRSRNRLSKKSLQKLADELELRALPIVAGSATEAQAWSDTISLTRHNHPTAHHAGSLELALKERVPPVTLDVQLKAAARAMGLGIYQP